MVDGESPVRFMYRLYLSSAAYYTLLYSLVKQEFFENKYGMNVVISEFETGSYDKFPDMFASLANETYEPETTFELVFNGESHLIILVTGDYLFDAIHKFMAKHSISPRQFTFCTGNFKCYEAYILWRSEYNINDPLINIEIIPGCKELVNTDRVPVVSHGPRRYKYTNLNNVPHLHRVEIINFLYENNFLRYGKNSFHQDHRALLPEIASLFPMEVDEGPNRHHVDHDHLFSDSYFSIVTESVFGRPREGLKPKEWDHWWKEGHITEKTFRAFFHLHPFIMVGAAGSLEFIRSLGYKTFDGLIDESYDDIVDHGERLLAVKEEIRKLCSMDLASLHEWYISLEDVLRHNQQCYLKSKWKHVPD